MFVELGDTLYVVKGNHSPTTGGLANPSVATAKWSEDGGAGDATGVTVTSPFDSVTGQIKVAVVCSSGNGFELGKRYSLMLYTTTAGVDSATEIANFQIVAAQTVAGYPAVDPEYWKGGLIPAPNVTGEPLADLNHWRGTQPLTLTSQRVEALVGAVSTGAITSGAFAAGAIDAAAIATDAIGAAELAAGAASEIAAAVWDLATSGHSTAGTFGKLALDIYAAIDTEVATLVTGVADVQSRLPAALSSGNMKADVIMVSGDATAADNLELQFDGTGLTGNTFPATQLQANTIDDYVDTEVAAILAAVDTEVATLVAGVADIQSRIPAALTAAGLIKADAIRWNNLVTVALPIAPTTAGRTITVSAAGNASINWGDVENKTTTVALTNTTIKDVTDVETALAALDAEIDAITSTLGGTLGVNVVQVSGDTGAADNLEAMLDGTGLVGVNYPARQQDVKNIAATSAAVNVVATSRVINTGSETGTLANTENADGTSWDLDGDDSVLSVEVTFDLSDVPAGLATLVSMTAYLSALGDTVKVEAWDGVGWDQIGEINGIATTTPEGFEFELTNSHTDTDAETAKIRFTDGGMSGTLKIDRLLVGVTAIPPTAAEIGAEIDVGVVDANVISVAADAISAAGFSQAAADKIIATLLAYAHASGTNVDGLLDRIEAFMTGELVVTEVSPTVLQYAWKKRGGATAFTGTIDRTTGSRSESTL